MIIITTVDWMLNLVRDYENTKRLHSIVKESKRYATDLDIELENEENTKVKKLRQHAKEQGHKQLANKWAQKPLHGQYALRSKDADVDQKNTH